MFQDSSLETRRDPRVLANIEKKIGNEYYRKSSYDVAIEHYSRALKYYSNDAVVYTNLAAASLEHAKEFTKRVRTIFFRCPCGTLYDG
jgi:tetratricopeptide (TPR) repeat protein